MLNQPTLTIPTALNNVKLQELTFITGEKWKSLLNTIWRPPTNVSKPLACFGIIQPNILETHGHAEYFRRIFIEAILTNAQTLI